jgi:predicted Zn-dependent protease
MSDVVERALALSRADGCVVVLQHRHSVNLRWANNTLTTNGSSRDHSLTVISVAGRSVGVRSASVLDDLEALVRASEEAARQASPADDYAALVEGPADPGFASAAESCTTAVFAELARDLGDSFAAARADGRRLFGFATHDVTTTWLGSSTGLRLRHAQPTGYVELTGKNDRPGGSTWVGRHTRDWSDVSVPALDGEVQRRLGWATRHVDLPAGRYETILPPSAMGDLMIYLYWMATGRDAAEGRTVFSRAGGGTRVGEHVGPPGLRLGSAPNDPALATSPFLVTTRSSSVSSVFDNGLALPATDWISGGALSALVHTRASAAASGVPVTPFVDNLVLDAGGTATTDELVASTGRGLLVTCLWYIRVVDPETLLLTGLTRDGVYLVEDGEVTGVVNNFRFNESPVDLLGRLAEVGRSEPSLPREFSDDFTWVSMPAVRVPDFNMSSVSQAS